METWKGLGDLLQQAKPDEQRIILQHYIEVCEIRFSSTEGKDGVYSLKLFPEVRPLDAPSLRDENRTPAIGIGGGPVLTEDQNLCQLGTKAPRVGLEPTTQRLTAACSTD